MVLKLQKRHFKFSQKNIIYFEIKRESKDFVFELFVKEDYNLNHVNLKVEITGQLLKQNLEFRKDSNFQINVSSEIEGQLNEYVEINYQRAKAELAVGQAYHKAYQKQQQQALELIDHQIQQIKQSRFRRIRKCKMYCKPKIFEMEGEAFLMKKESNHIVRQFSLNKIDQLCNQLIFLIGMMINYKIWSIYKMEIYSASGSLKGSGSEVSSQPDFQRDLDFDNFDPKFIIKQLLKMKQFKQEQLEQEDEEEDQKIELLKEQLRLIRRN